MNMKVIRNNSFDCSDLSELFKKIIDFLKIKKKIFLKNVD
jgi:hypothetical protein